MIPPAVAVLLALAIVIGCEGQVRSPAPGLAAGDPARGRRALERYGCGSCHVIPGVRGARGAVGPSLAGLARRPYLAGSLVNEPGNLVAWVQDPRTLAPGTIMPDLEVTASDAQDIAAFLYRGAPRPTTPAPPATAAPDVQAPR